MLKKEELIEIVREILPESEFPEGTQLTEVIVPADKYLAFIKNLKADIRIRFDYLIDLTAVDFKTYFMVVNHLESTDFRHLLVVKVKITDRENPEIDSISEIYPTAEFFEREVFDLFGIRFKNHPNLKRLYLEDNYGYPLRKDFRDEVNFIER